MSFFKAFLRKGLVMDLAKPQVCGPDKEALGRWITALITAMLGEIVTSVLMTLFAKPKL